MKGFGFVSDAAEREYKEFSKETLQVFGISLRAIQEGKRPFIPITNIKESVGKGAFELKIQGSPAIRCVYVQNLRILSLFYILLKKLLME